MTDDVIVTTGEEAGAVAEQQTEQTEAVTEAAVEVAKVEADKEVRIAEIEAETAEHAIDVAAGVAEKKVTEENAQDRLISDLQQEMNECRTQLSAMAELVGTLTGQVSSIQEQLTPPQESPSEPLPEESVVETQESQEVVAEPSPRKARRLRLI